jgi:hypothetical protein
VRVVWHLTREGRRYCGSELKKTAVKMSRNYSQRVEKEEEIDDVRD